MSINKLSHLKEGEKIYLEVTRTFYPENLIHPGITLGETLEAMGIAQKELAIRAGISEKQISGIINGANGITPETALKLERVLGIPASFWNNLEKAYQEDKVRLEELKQLANDGMPKQEITIDGSLGDRWSKVNFKGTLKTLPEKGYLINGSEVVHSEVNVFVKNQYGGISKAMSYTYPQKTELTLAEVESRLGLDAGSLIIK